MSSLNPKRYRAPNLKLPPSEIGISTPNTSRSLPLEEFKENVLREKDVILKRMT